MFKIKTGAKGDSCKVSTHIEFKRARRKIKEKSNMSMEQFKSNCQRAEEMLSKSRW